jgi:Tol biopolymer transport system component
VDAVSQLHSLLLITAAAATGAGAAALAPGAQPAAVQALTMGMPSLAVSADGRFVAFESRESLTPDDVSPAVDIYVLDRATRAITLESAQLVATDGAGDNSRPQLSANGRFVVFTSGADLAHAGGGERFPRVFLRDRERGTTRCLSVGVNAHGEQGSREQSNGASSEAVISADGSVVAFTSQATNLVSGSGPDSDGSDVYLWRRDTQTLSRIARDELRHLRDIDAPVLAVYEASLSADGGQIAFTVMFDQFETRDTLMERRGVARRKLTRVYVKDLRTGVIERAGCPTQERDACERGRDFRPVLSANGRFVAFASTANDRVKDDGNQLTDVLLFDRQTRAVTLVSRTPSGRSGNEASWAPAVSGDGRFVTFESRASNLVCERHCAEPDADRNLVSDIFLFDRDSGIVSRVSGGDEPWWDASVGPAIDEAGDVIAFSSAHAMGPEDWRGDFDLFVWARQALTWRPPQTPVAFRRSYNAPADGATADLLRPFCRTCDAAGAPGARGAGPGALGRRHLLEEPRRRDRRPARGDARGAARGPYRGAL